MENMYKAPEANLENQSAEDESSQFYVVSIKKFWTLFVCTQGSYLVYWMYKNWQLIKSQTQLSCWPVARAIFSIFFFHDLYRRVDRALEKNGKDSKWQLNGLATTTVVIFIVERIVDRVSSKMDSIGVLDIASLLFVFVTAGVISKAQKSINIASGDEHGESNCYFSALNIIWILLGLGLWVFVISVLLGFDGSQV
jgi:hypothetical protein